MQLLQEIQIAKEYLTSMKIHFSDLWIESLLQWIREENGANITEDVIKRKVLEQWLVLDLRDLEVGILPTNFSSFYNRTLNDTFYLQVMFVEDISRPKLAQYEKIRKDRALTTSNETNNNENCINRMLQLTLTDGMQEVIAIEYEKIPSLSLNMTPGIKICISGPVTVRKGIFLLENKNLRVIGGDVEELLVCNAAENVICRSLNKPENPKPLTVADFNESPIQHQNVVPNHVPARNVSGAVPSHVNQRQNGSNNKNSIQTSASALQSHKPSSYAHAAATECLTDLPSDWDEDEDFPKCSDVEMLLESSAAATRRHQKTPDKRTKQPANFQPIMSPEDLFDDDFEYDDMNLTLIESNAKAAANAHSSNSNRNVATKRTLTDCSDRKSAAKKQLLMNDFAAAAPPPPPPKQQECKSSVVRALNQTASTSAKDVPLRFVEDDFFNEDELDMHLFEIEEQLEREQHDSEAGLTTIEKLLKQNSFRLRTNELYKIKAKFKEVADKLQLSEKFGIYIKVRVSDHSGELVVKMENDFIEKFACVTKSRLLLLKPKVLDKSARDEFFSFFSAFKEKLEAIDNVLLIEVKDDAFCVVDVL